MASSLPCSPLFLPCPASGDWVAIEQLNQEIDVVVSFNHHGLLSLKFCFYTMYFQG